MLLKTLVKVAEAFGISDLLLVLGLTTLIGGIAAIHRPSASIVFGIICLYLWLAKNRKAA